jgi:hypothetical protein
MSNITPSVLSNSIMAKLYDVLTNGDDTMPKSTDNFLSFVTPGQVVSKDQFRFMKQGLTGTVQPEAAQALLQTKSSEAAAGGATGSSAGASGSASAPAPATGLTQADRLALEAKDTVLLFNAAESLAGMMDFVPDVAYLSGKKLRTLAIQSDNGSLSDVYKLTLDMCQIMQTVIPDAEKTQLERLRGLLTTTTKTTDIVTGAVTDVVGPSPLVVAYNSKMATYDNAWLAYNTARINALTAANPADVEYFAFNAPILRNQMNAALDDWITTGYKNQYEEIAAFIAQVEGRDLSLLLAAYKDDLAKAKITNPTSGGDFYYTSLAPFDFYDVPTWPTFHFGAGDFETHSQSSYNASGWSAQASAGFFGIGASGGASGSSSRSQYTGTFNSDYCRMSFEITQAQILRSWLKTSFLNSKTWRFNPGNPDIKNNLLSDGGAPPKGLLPAYPTSAIFVRNLMLDFGDNSGFRSWMDQHSASSQGGSANFSFGPFSIGGGGSHSEASGSSSSSSGYHWTDQGLSMPDMQLVGFRCHVMPQAPKPSPDITAWI